MRILDRIGLAALHQFDPETAHGLAIKALEMGVVPTAKHTTSERLSTRIGPLALNNPIGLAAGFDKNAEVPAALSKTGFGFLEVGAATPRPQPGNPKPRLFRLSDDKAAINRFGFNNEGMDVIGDRLAAYRGSVPLGLNLGANKDSEDRAADYRTVLARCGAQVDFATVNISSPNTEKLRDLQGPDALRALLDGVMDERAKSAPDTPIFLKIAPDLDNSELEAIAVVAKDVGIDAIIATNTTIDRHGLRSAHASEKGGLSGAPLFDPSTRVLARLYTLTDLPLVGVGGVSSARDAYDKIKAGAVAVQLYTALIYKGLGLIPSMVAELDQLLAADGYTSVAEAVGKERDRWLT